MFKDQYGFKKYKKIKENLKTMLSTCDRCGKLDLIFSVAIICTMVKPYHNYVRNRNSHK